MMGVVEVSNVRWVPNGGAGPGTRHTAMFFCVEQPTSYHMPPKQLGALPFMTTQSSLFRLLGLGAHHLEKAPSTNI
jgi:hypothetical protein